MELLRLDKYLLFSKVVLKASLLGFEKSLLPFLLL